MHKIFTHCSSMSCVWLSQVFLKLGLHTECNCTNCVAFSLLAFLEVPQWLRQSPIEATPNLITEVRTTHAAVHRHVSFVMGRLPWRFTGWLFADLSTWFHFPAPCWTLSGLKWIFTPRLKEEQIKVRFIQPTIMSVENALTDSWMWLKPRVNRAPTGDFSSTIGAWVTDSQWRTICPGLCASLGWNGVSQQGHKCTAVPWRWRGPLEHRESCHCSHQNWKWCSDINIDYNNIQTSQVRMKTSPWEMLCFF